MSKQTTTHALLAGGPAFSGKQSSGACFAGHQTNKKDVSNMQFVYAYMQAFMYVCIYMCGFVYVFNIKDLNNISIDIIDFYI